MKHLATYIIIALMAVVAVACGHSDSFRLHGELTDGSNINLRVMYFTNDGVRTGITASNAGKFMFEGQAPKPALVEIYDNDYRLLGRFIARNGDDIELSVDRRNPYLTVAKGNELSEAMTKFLNSKADELQASTIAERNAMVADYVSANPSAPESYLLLVTEFSTPGFEQLADSLLGLIPEEVRLEGVSAGFETMLQRIADGMAATPVAPIPYLVSGNDTKIYKPSDARLSLIVLSDSRDGRDSILDAVRDLDRHRSKGRFDIIDLNLDQDTMVWRRTVRTDSAAWTQGWAAGGVSAQAVDRLGIPSLPYMVLVDSAGHQLWRGNSVTIAKSQTLKFLK